MYESPITLVYQFVHLSMAQRSFRLFSPLYSALGMMAARKMNDVNPRRIFRSKGLSSPLG